MIGIAFMAFHNTVYIFHLPVFNCKEIGGGVGGGGKVFSKGFEKKVMC